MNVASSKISGLVENIYDAALEPARWSDVVADINTFVGGRACGIISKDPVSKLGETHHYFGADPHYIKLYADGYAKFDPLARLPAPGRVVSIPDLVPYDEYRRGPFYQEWLRPQGCVDVANVLLDDSDSTLPTLLTFLVGKAIMDADMRRRIALVAPHVKRALMINRVIEHRKNQASTFADTLDGLSAAIFLVDAQCRIVHANVAGQEMLSEDDFFRCIGGQLVACDRQVNRDLREGVANRDTAITDGRVAFSLTAQDGQHYVAHLLPLRSGMRASLEASSTAVAAVFIRRVELNGQSYGGIVARTFRLTPAELRVLLTIVEVGGVPETSERLGVAETTVKTHLYRVFSKTGVNRQADLVKLAAGFSNPLAN
jgi:DNA-binding CsgD family transcriptional regulator/PAS domain-containing protein